MLKGKMISLHNRACHPGGCFLGLHCWCSTFKSNHWVSLTHWGLVTPYGDSDLGQHWLRQWLVAWWHQAITWTNVDLSSEGFCGILLRTVSQELLKVSIQDMSLKKTFWKLFSNLPGANELKGGHPKRKSTCGQSSNEFQRLDYMTGWLPG